MDTTAVFQEKGMVHCSRMLARYKERSRRKLEGGEDQEKPIMDHSQTESQCTLLVFTEIGKGSKQ